MKRVVLILLFLVVSGCKSKNRENSYAALSDRHKKLADDCMNTTGSEGDGLLIKALDNESADTTRILLNIDSGSFIRCDYKLKTSLRIKAEAISDGSVIKTF